MHWTLQALIALCAACVLFNIAQYIMVRSVRIVGLLICSAWAVQQSYWWHYEQDSVVLFVACDAAIIAWFLSRRRAFDMREMTIACTIPLTTAIGIGGFWNGGLHAGWWWINWSVVTAQMIAGLPLPQRQRALGANSHGPLTRPQET